VKAAAKSQNNQTIGRRRRGRGRTRTREEDEEQDDDEGEDNDNKTENLSMGHYPPIISVNCCIIVVSSPQQLLTTINRQFDRGWDGLDDENRVYVISSTKIAL
jgi:hypothetical protein